MHLHFLGTRGEIAVRPRQHRMYTALLSHRTGRVMIDCGLDWLRPLRPDAIVLTHAHSDHTWGLKNGARVSGFRTGPIAEAACA
jgi:glyoxylase-like metal-dependent hydrolase (beta-lactamase superfamily II)